MISYKARSQFMKCPDEDIRAKRTGEVDVCLHGWHRPGHVILTAGKQLDTLSDCLSKHPNTRLVSLCKISGSSAAFAVSYQCLYAREAE